MGLMLLSLMTLFMACGTDEVGQTTGTPPSSGPTSDVEMVSYTHAVPDGYDQDADERGSVVRIDYDTRDYAKGSGVARTNTAYVYLPYGYDENRRYNILYFVHGHYSTAASTFEDENGVVRKLLDQMIAHGDIDPMIVVTPSYNYGQPTASYADADPYCRALPKELVNDLIPVNIVPSAVSQWVRLRLGMPSTRHSMRSSGLCPLAVTAGRWAGLPE